MSNNVNINVRMNEELKKKAEVLFEELGLNMSTAVNMFVRQAVREGGIPFKPTTEVYNAETIAALQEAERIAKDPEAKKYASFADVLKELEIDV